MLNWFQFPFNWIWISSHWFQSICFPDVDCYRDQVAVRLCLTLFVPPIHSVGCIRGEITSRSRGCITVAYPLYNGGIPSGKLTWLWLKSHFLSGTLITSISIFNSYVSLPEGSPSSHGEIYLMISRAATSGHGLQRMWDLGTARRGLEISQINAVIAAYQVSNHLFICLAIIYI